MRKKIYMKKQELKIKIFDSLTAGELYEIVVARCEIFLLEEGIICQDFDGVDYESLHCFIEEDGRVLAYLRAYMQDGAVKIGRVLTRTHGIGLGRQLIEGAMPKIIEHFGTSEIVLNSQSHAIGFYEKLGFEVTSEEFLEEGVPHVAMKYKKQGELV